MTSASDDAVGEGPAPIAPAKHAEQREAAIRRPARCQVPARLGEKRRQQLIR